MQARIRSTRDASDTPFSTAQYYALSKALAAGVTRVTVEGRTTEYQTAEDMMKTLAMMKAELEAAGLLPVTVTTRNKVHVYGHKGLW